VNEDSRPSLGTMAAVITLTVVVVALLVALGLYIGGRSSGDDTASGGFDPDTGLVDETPTLPADEDAAPESTPGTAYDFDGHGANVEKAMFGDAWPLTLPGGRVNCVVDATNGQVSVVFTSDDNKRYALNGVANSHAGVWGYLPLDAIWAQNPATGAKKDIGVLIDICAPLMP